MSTYLQIILKDLCKVILKLRSSEVGQNFLPIRWSLQVYVTTPYTVLRHSYIKPSQIRLLLSSKYLECSGLSYAISTDKPEYYSRSRCGQTVKLEWVGTVAMGSVLLKVARKIDDGDCFKRAFLYIINYINNCGLMNDFTFVQIPHPIQSVSEMWAILSIGVTSMQSFPGVLYNIVTHTHHRYV